MINKPKLLVSSCLLGMNVKYDGGNNLIDNLDKLNEIFEIFPVCPEVDGGMIVPRIPSEIISHNPLKIENEYGIETTDFFKSGAINSLDICKKYDIKIALLKSKSPSCGNIKIYDGTFSSTLIDGIGIAANTLQYNGIKIFNENQIEKLYEYI
ncbi:MAG: DUF523 domain-containing protein [Arcobacteraceae bacterium]|nr:DUF523 domain-containing protein [Arcobacteraceae bacterium]